HQHGEMKCMDLLPLAPRRGKRGVLGGIVGNHARNRLSGRSTAQKGWPIHGLSWQSHQVAESAAPKVERRARRGRVSGLALIVAYLHLSPAVHAQPARGELDQARETYRTALALETAGDWAGALAKMRDVAAVKLTPQVRFHLA